MMKTYPSKLMLSFLFLATLFTTTLQAQGGDESDPPTTPFQIVKAAGESGGNQPICLTVLKVFVTNLELYGVTKNEETGLYTITNEVDPLYAQVLLAGNNGLFHINEFKHFGTFTSPDPDNPLNSTISTEVYLAEIEIPNSWIPYCGEDETVTYNAKIRLLTPGSSSGGTTIGGFNLPAGYIYYPTADYAGTSELFACHVFDFTACICEESCTTTTSTFNSEISCRRPCRYNEHEVGLGDLGLISHDNGNQITASKGLKAYPNPFTSSFELSYTASIEERITIRLMNSNGQQVGNWQEKVYRGDNVLSLDTEDLPAGIYFLEISSMGQQAQFLKLFKD